MSGSRRTIGILLSIPLLMLGLLAVAGPAGAAHVSCGQTIMASTVLDSDVGPCAEGLTIGANGITLDLNGFTLSGTPVPGDGAGILLADRAGVTVKGGTVTQFDAGVALERGTRNTVTNMKALHNRGDFNSDYGDGITMFLSHHNVVTNNHVENNGPYDGIGTLGANGNLISGNQVRNNNQVNFSTAGIRLENLSGGRSSNDNTVTFNVVSGNATFGIQLFAGARSNVVRGNQVFDNRLDGITAFAASNSNLIERNSVRNNGTNGIFIRGPAGNFGPTMNNLIRNNSAFGNVQFDLLDGNPNCGTNVWTGNKGNTFAPPCTKNP